MFRSLQLLRLPNGIRATPDALAEQLTKGAFQPCPSNARRSTGWVEPYFGTGLVFAQDQQHLTCFQVEEKILPSAYINRLAVEKAAEIEKQQGHKPGRKQMREIRDNIELELLPRAFTRLSRSLIWIDNRNGWMAVDGSPARAADVVQLLKRSMDMLPCLSMPRTNTNPATAMTAWLAAGEAPSGLTIDRDCELRAATEEQAMVRYTRSNLDSDDVRHHIVQGKAATRIALTWNDRVSFILTESLEIKRIQLLDILKEDAAQQAENGEDLFAATFAIYTGELAKIIAAVIEACGGEVPDIDDAKESHDADTRCAESATHEQTDEDAVPA